MFKRISLLLVAAVFVTAGASAQTDIRITGPQAGFPVAVPQLCDAGAGAPLNVQLAEVISKDLQISGIFKVLNPGTFVEAPGKCGGLDKIAFSDWTVIGAEGLVKGEVRKLDGSQVQIELVLYDVAQQRAVLGKRYQAESGDYARVAHRFANEIMKFFTGEEGIFGTRIAYVSKVGRFKEIFLMDLDGSNQRQLTNDRGLAISPSWSRDGGRIAYTSYRSKTPDLYVLSPDGGAPQRVTDRPGLELAAKFLPEGQTLVASASNQGASNLVLFDLRGQLLKKITTGDTIDTSPSPSPDGSRVAFCSNRAGGPQIFVVDVAGGAPKRISFTNSNYCTSPAWSPKGDKIAFVCRAGGNQLFLAAPDGTQAVQLTFAGNNEDPNWSPDGQAIAFSSDSGRGSARNLYVLPIISGAPRQISYSRSEDSQPAWSPKVD